MNSRKKHPDLRLTWRLESPKGSKTVTLDHERNVNGLSMFSEMKTFLFKNSDFTENSDGIFVTESPVAFNNCCKKAGIA